MTTQAQTLCELLLRMRLDRWEATTDELLLAHELSIQRLAERRDAWEASRRPGIGLLCSLVDERTTEGWVPPEGNSSLFSITPCCSSGTVPTSSGRRERRAAPTSERVDGLIRQWMVILEADGRRRHARLRDFERDRWRDNQAAALGYRVLRLTWNHLNHRLDEVVEMIRQAGHTSAAA